MTNPFSALLPHRTQRRRDYAGSAQRTQNPMFTQPKPKRRVPWVFLLAVVAVIGTFIYMVAAPQYRITTVTVTGAQKLSTTSIIKFVNSRLDRGLLGIAWRRVTFLTPTNELTTELRTSIERLLSLNGLTITRRGTHELVVAIQERTPHLIWQARTGERYFIDEKGIIVELVPEGTPDTFQTLNDANGIATGVGQQVARQDYVSALETVATRLSNANIAVKSFSTWGVECRKINTTPTPVIVNSNTNSTVNSNSNTVLINAGDDNSSTDVNVPSDEPCDLRQLAIDDPTLVVTTAEGWDIRFDVTVSLDAQMRKLTETINQRFKDSRQGLKYIDVRFGDKVYYQ